MGSSIPYSGRSATIPLVGSFVTQLMLTERVELSLHFQECEQLLACRSHIIMTRVLLHKILYPIPEADEVGGMDVEGDGVMLCKPQSQL